MEWLIWSQLYNRLIKIRIQIMSQKTLPDIIILGSHAISWVHNLRENGDVKKQTLEYTSERLNICGFGIWRSPVIKVTKHNNNWGIHLRKSNLTIFQFCRQKERMAYRSHNGTILRYDMTVITYTQYRHQEQHTEDSINWQRVNKIPKRIGQYIKCASTIWTTFEKHWFLEPFAFPS